MTDAFLRGSEKPRFLYNNTREVFEAKCHTLYDGIPLEEIKYVLTSKQFEALDLVFFKGRGQNAAAAQLGLTPHTITERLQGAANRIEKWKQWKAAQGNSK